MFAQIALVRWILYGLRHDPLKLSGARIVAVADAYDAMTHDRPYKRAMSHDAVIAELRRHAGTRFDPELVESFCDLYSNEVPVPDPAVFAMIAGAETRQTMGPDGALGVTNLAPEPRSTRRHEATGQDDAVTTLPTPGSPRTGRSESAR